MKILKYIFWVTFLLTMGVMTASAQQLSVLPLADPKADCASLLQIYELTGKIPLKKEVASKQGENALSKYQKASEAYDAATKAYKDAEWAFSTNNVNKEKEEAMKKAKAEQEKAEVAKNEASQASSEATKNALAESDNNTPERDNLLGCAIKTGRISLQMVPFFITYIANFILSIISLLCVLFIVIGGYQYIVGGLTDQKEKGKNTIKHALMGMSIAILSWVIVTAVMNAITG